MAERPPADGDESPMSVDAAAEPSPVPGVSRNVFVFGLVSFVADVSSEMIYPVLPFFLATTLGTPIPLIGVIEGVAEGTASTSKVWAGWWSDRLPRRLPLVAAGYGLSAVGKLLLAVSFVWPQALGARFTDRLGKGVRTAPRDALIADSSFQGERGRVFGFHRALDTAGAVVGPLLALSLVAVLGQDELRPFFLLALVPAALSVPLVFLAREGKRRVLAPPGEPIRIAFKGAPIEYWFFLGVSVLFAFGNSSDAFLLLRAGDVGLALTAVILAYVVYNASYALLSYPAGIVSDRLGHRIVLAAGYFLFGLVYLGFASVDGQAAIWLLFAGYGMTMALTEGVARALVTDQAPTDRRGGFLGLYHTAVGVTAVLASVLAGLLWEFVSPAAPFALGAVTGLAAAALLMGWTLLDRLRVRQAA